MKLWKQKDSVDVTLACENIQYFGVSVCKLNMYCSIKFVETLEEGLRLIIY